MARKQNGRSRSNGRTTSQSIANGPGGETHQVATDTVLTTNQGVAPRTQVVPPAKKGDAKARSRSRTPI